MDSSDDKTIDVSSLLHCAFRRITLIINQQMHLHKISHYITAYYRYAATTPC